MLVLRSRISRAILLVDGAVENTEGKVRIVGNFTSISVYHTAANPADHSSICCRYQSSPCDSYAAIGFLYKDSNQWHL